MKRASFPGFTVGVTGGIGSGKSTVCRMLQEFGRTVLTADPLARDLMESDPGMKAQLRKLLGNEIYTSTGNLDRRLVASKIFNNRQLLQRVNTLVHPAVLNQIQKLIEALPEDRRSPYCVIEAALVYESGMHKLLSAVVVVDAPLEIRLARVQSRDASPEAEILRRANAQMRAEAMSKLADFTIRNSDTEIALKERVAFIDRLLVRMSMQPNRGDSR